MILYAAWWTFIAPVKVIIHCHSLAEPIRTQFCLIVFFWLAIVFNVNLLFVKGFIQLLLPLII